MTIQTIPIEKIVKGRNPRKRFDKEKLQELALSIKEEGLLQPIVVEPATNGNFILVMGERRLRAHELLKRRNIKAIVRDQTNHSGRERFLHAIIENDQRENMNPVERADAYQVLQDEYGWTVNTIAQKTGKPATTVYNYLMITRLEPEIRDLIEKGFWHDPRLVRGLLQIRDKNTRIGLAERLFKHKVSLKGSLEATNRTLSAEALVSEKRKPAGGRGRVPVLEYAQVEQKPMRWDAMKQLGQVPAWEMVVYAATETCQLCPMRNIASPINCEGCASVTLLQKLMEATK